jgi:leucyl aminopeptidase
MEVRLRKEPGKRDLLAVPVLGSKPVATGVRRDLGETYVLHADKDGARHVAVGLGPSAELDADAIRTAAAAVAREVRRPGGSLAWPLDARLRVPTAEQARAVVEGVVLGSYDPGSWKSNGKEVEPPKSLVLVTDEASLKDEADRAASVADWANRARDLANAPPNELTPERLAARAAEIAKGSRRLKSRALTLAQIEGLGMGAFAAVARASHNPARMIVMRYDPPRPKPADVVLGLVGKAITFDTGGISLKPALGMEEMKGDMAGGAAVIESMGAIAELGFPLRMLAVVAASENMIGGRAYRPGDILRAMNGKTIEITNTDAEGRLVLADGLSYARDQGATHLLDLATLTGAMEIALGDLYAGVFANDDEWLQEVLTAGEASGDHAWPFPLHRRYRRYVDSSFADMKNSSDLRQAGPALAAEFLKEFVGDGPWAHIDMAGPGFLSRSRGDYLWQRGGTGYGVRLIVELARRLTERD